MNEKFKKVFLSFNEERYTSEVEELKKQCEDFNLQIGNLRRVLREEKDFTKEQKIQIKSNAYEFLNQFLENIKPFKNADLDFNLQSMGLQEAKGILHEWKRRTNEFKSYDFELNDKNRFEVPDSQIQSIKERYTVYTTTPEQNVRLELAKELETLLNKAVSINMISVYSRPSIAKSIQGITIGANPEAKDYQFVIDTYNV